MKSYSWKAIYLDGSFLSQYDDDGENFFQDIQLDNLDVFTISDSVNDSAFQINVKHGLISINKVIFSFGPNISNRLIYFRRIRQPFTFGSFDNKTIFHCFGLQATVNGVNKKIVFGVNEKTSFVEVLEAVV